METPPSSIDKFLTSQLGAKTPLTELTDTQAERFRQWAASVPGTNIATSPRSIVFDGQSSKMSMTTLTEYTLDYKKNPDSPSGYEPRHEQIKTGVEIEFRPELRHDNELIKLGLSITKSDILEIEKKIHESGNDVQLPAINKRELATTLAIPVGKYYLINIAGITNLSPSGISIQPAKSKEQTILLVKATVYGLGIR